MKDKKALVIVLVCAVLAIVGVVVAIKACAGPASDAQATQDADKATVGSQDVAEQSASSGVVDGVGVNTDDLADVPGVVKNDDGSIELPPNDITDLVNGLNSEDGSSAGEKAGESSSGGEGSGGSGSDSDSDALDSVGTVGELPTDKL